MLDAYTIRKAIPRLLVAAIAINLSIYFCVALIDVVNVIGQGIGDLIVKPFKTDQAFGGQGIGGTSNNIYGGVFWVLTILSGVGIWKIFKGVKGAASKDTSLGAGQFLLTKGAIILIPFILFIILISLAVVFTLVLRQGLIIFLAVISPVAFALFVLPGTEKYFKKWLDLFFSTLMVYPIVAVLFAVSSALTSVLVGNANAAGGLPGVTSALAAVVVAFAPLVMIPFAFKIAGGVLGAIMNSAGGKAGGLVSRTRKGLQNTGQDPTSFLGSKIFDYKSNVADARANLYNQTRNAGSVRRLQG